MIDALVKVAEKLTELLKYREQRREKRWKGLFEPTFASLQAVHKDYLKIFDAVRVGLEADEKCAELLSTLETRRVEQETSRRTIEHMAEAMAEREDMSQAERRFFGSVYYYFRYVPLTTLGPESQSSSALTSLGLNLQEAAKIERFDAEAARELATSGLKNANRSVRDSWIHICKEYASLQVEFGVV